MPEEESMSITVKRSAKKKSGFRVEQGSDGHYYISRIPRNGNTQGIQVGDRVLSINGTHFLDFANEKKANDLIETFKMDVVPADDDDDDDDDEESSDGEEESDDEELSDYDDAHHETSIKKLGGSSADAKQTYRTAANNPGQGSDGDNNWSDSEEDEEDDEEEWIRPTGRYQPMDRFMVTVSKSDDPYDPGIKLASYKGDYYVCAVSERGPFYTTSIDKGDKILSLNGKKSKDITSVEHALELIDSKQKITVFVMRPDPSMDKGHRWVMSKYSE